MVLTDNEALNKIVDLLKDIKQLEKGHYLNDSEADKQLMKE